MNEDAIAVFIPIVAIFMSLLIPIVFEIVQYRGRRAVIEAHHRERLAAIERGTDIPPLPESFYNPVKPNRGPRYLLTGMIWFFIGVAIFIALGSLAGDDVRNLGLIPAGVGLAYLIYYAVHGRHEQPAASSSPVPGSSA